MQKRPSPLTASGAFDPLTPVAAGEEARRQRILDAMIASCAEKTYAGTTIADIVKLARISRTTFYRRFADKRACFDAALDSCVAELEAVAAAAHTASDSPPEAVRKATAAALELLASKPALAQLVVADAVTVEPATVERYRSLLIPALERLWRASGNEPTRSAAANPSLAFGKAQVLVFSQIAAGRTRLLPDLLPEIVYIVLLPFAGHEEAIRQAELARENTRMVSR